MRLEQAIELVRRFHAETPDKAGRPYREHVLRVADAVETHDEKLTAVMHDLDTVPTRTDLLTAGCPPRVEAARQASADPKFMERAKKMLAELRRRPSTSPMSAEEFLSRYSER